MTGRPYVLLSAAMSVDGFIDDASGNRLVLSGPADQDRVDEVRAGCDAILVGAGTVRRDDPRLLIRSAARRAERAARGLPPDPLRVAVSGSGNLDPAGRFFTAGRAASLVYVPDVIAGQARATLAGAGAEVIAATDPARPRRVSLPRVLADLRARGVRRLMVEGGAEVLAGFLAAGLADELQLAIAPFFVADPAAPRLLAPAVLPHGPARPMRLAGVGRIGDVVLARYLLSGAAEPGAAADR